MGDLLGSLVRRSKKWTILCNWGWVVTETEREREREMPFEKLWKKSMSFTPLAFKLFSKK
jgi:hypothetical protein